MRKWLRLEEQNVVHAGEVSPTPRKPQKEQPQETQELPHLCVSASSHLRRGDAHIPSPSFSRLRLAFKGLVCLVERQRS